MADKKVKTVEEFEREKGYINPKLDPKKKMSEEEFNSNFDPTQIVGVHFEDRINFLKSNGYEVTRENMIDPNLSHRNLEE